MLKKLGLLERRSNILIFSTEWLLKAKEMTQQVGLYKEQLNRSLRYLRDRNVVKATVSFPAVFYAIPFEEGLDLLTEIRNNL